MSREAKRLIVSMAKNKTSEFSSLNCAKAGTSLSFTGDVLKKSVHPKAAGDCKEEKIKSVCFLFLIGFACTNVLCCLIALVNDVLRRFFAIICSSSKPEKILAV